MREARNGRDREDMGRRRRNGWETRKGKRWDGKMKVKGGIVGRRER